MKSLGIYLHLPFCSRKCAYCDFLSAPAEEKEKLRYIEALHKEIRSYHTLAENYCVDTVFFGGGTPSILKPQQIEGLMLALRESFAFVPEAGALKNESVLAPLEVTLEANPGTLTEEKLRIYRRSGIQRLSIGLQSANNKELKLLGRIHTWENFLESYTLARKLGFANINIDLMSALPGQTIQSYQETLQRVLELEPEHISAYSLIIEENTPFYEAWEKGSLLLPEEETERQMYYLTGELLEAAGYQHYEISNYAKPGYESRHNNKYWTGEEYLGLGLGAASYLQGSRRKNTSCLADYIKRAEEGSGLVESEQVLTRNEKMEEFMFLGLRRIEGISKAHFLECFGEELLDIYGEIIEKQERQGLVQQDAQRLWLTPRGIDISNTVMAEYLF